MTTTSVASPSMPGPRPLPLLGWRGNDLLFGRDPIGYMRSAYQSYGTVAAGVQNRPFWVLAFGPDNNRYILSNPDLFYSSLLGMPVPPDSALKRLTSGLLGMNGAQHQQQRQLILPAFHKQAIAGYAEDMVTLTQQMLDEWRIGQRLDLSQEMRRLTLCVASKALFGRDARSEQANIGALIQRWLAEFTSVPVYALPKDLPLTPYRRLLRLSEHLEAQLLAIIAQKRAALATQPDVLSTLIRARDQDGTSMSDSDLVGQANLLFIAGHETSANALTWTLFLLAQHPRVLAEVRDELEDVLRGDAPSLGQLGQLPLLERVIKESMRLLPPAPYGARYSVAPFELGPYRLAANTTVLFSSYITHHMAELYWEPERFVPERWETIAPSPYEYLPFGAGPRMCIGAAFAMQEIKIVLAMILQRYQLSLVPDAPIDRKVTLTLSPKRGMPMRVERVDRRVTRSDVRGNIHEMVALGT